MDYLTFGAKFESKLMEDLCDIAGIQKSRTTPYQPMTEKFNRTLLDMLGTLGGDQKRDWKYHVAPLVHTYNITRHDSTQSTSFFLMFGGDIPFATDIAFGLSGTTPVHKLFLCVESLRDRLKKCYELAAAAA